MGTPLAGVASGLTLSSRKNNEPSKKHPNHPEQCASTDYTRDPDQGRRQDPGEFVGGRQENIAADSDSEGAKHDTDSNYAKEQGERQRDGSIIHPSSNLSYALKLPKSGNQLPDKQCHCRRGADVAELLRSTEHNDLMRVDQEVA